MEYLNLESSSIGGTQITEVIQDHLSVQCLTV